MKIRTYSLEVLSEKRVALWPKFSKKCQTKNDCSYIPPTSPESERAFSITGQFSSFVDTLPGTAMLPSETGNSCALLHR